MQSYCGNELQVESPIRPIETLACFRSASPIRHNNISKQEVRAKGVDLSAERVSKEAMDSMAWGAQGKFIPLGYVPEKSILR